MLSFSSKVMSFLAVAAALWGGAARAQDFTCGPHALTYEVQQAQANGFRVVVGIRCVKVVNNQSFAWYGEGRWGSFQYRNVGYGSGDIFNGGVRFVGYQGDIHGNGENGTAFWNGDFTLTATAPITAQPARIDLRNSQGNLLESWHLATQNRTTYTMLPFPMLRCSDTPPGNHAFVEQMRVRKGGTVLETDRRCLLNLRGTTHLPYAWVGSGVFEGRPYFHLGVGNFQPNGGWLASDLCFTGNHMCLDFPEGGIQLTRQQDTSIFASGAWTETWFRF
jgi:hypothetical protein